MTPSVPTAAHHARSQCSSEPAESTWKVTRGRTPRSRRRGESFTGCSFCIPYGAVTSARHPAAGQSSYLWRASAPPPPRPAPRRGPEGAREPAGGHRAASPPPLAAEAPPLRPAHPAACPPARPPSARARSPALALAPSRPRRRGRARCACRAGKRREPAAPGTFTAGAAPGPERAPSPPPLPLLRPPESRGPGRRRLRPAGEPHARRPPSLHSAPAGK